jgi:hypothetical protein
MSTANGHLAKRFGDNMSAWFTLNRGSVVDSGTRDDGRYEFQYCIVQETIQFDMTQQAK